MEGLEKEPKALKDREQLRADNIGIWNAYQILSASRTESFSGAGSIPVGEIISYFTFVEGISDPETLRDTVYLFRALDVSLMDHMRTKENGV